MTRALPIGFSESMVLALLDGRKSVTRRLAPGNVFPRGAPWIGLEPGDLLWVQEFHTVTSRRSPSHPAGPAIGGVYLADRAPWSVDPWPERLRWPGEEPRRLPRFMPIEASRLTLRLEEKPRLEDITAITEAEAKAEGIQRFFDRGAPRWGVEAKGPLFPTAREAFVHLWQSLHGDRFKSGTMVTRLGAFTVLRQNVRTLVAERGVAA